MSTDRSHERPGATPAAVCPPGPMPLAGGGPRETRARETGRVTTHTDRLVGAAMVW